MQRSRLFTKEQISFLSESATTGLRTTIDVPFVTSPLTPEEKSWLLNHNPSDLVTMASSQDNVLLTKILKGIAVNVVSNIASEFIIDSLFKQSPTQKALEEKKAQASAESALPQETLNEIDSVVEESMSSEKAEIDKLTNELIEDLSKKAETVAEKAKNKGLTSTKDYDKMKDIFKDKIMKDGVKAYLAEEIKYSAKKNLKQNALLGQKAAKNAAKATTEKLSRKQLQQIAKNAKSKVYQSSKTKVKALIELTDVGVDYADKLQSSSFKQTTTEIVVDKAVKVAQEQFINVFSKALPKVVGSVVQQYGMKFLGGLGMFLESSSLGTGADLYDSSKPYPGEPQATISSQKLDSFRDGLSRLRF